MKNKNIFIFFAVIIVGMLIYKDCDNSNNPPTHNRKVIKKSISNQEWYEGGTLHKSTIREWKNSTERNKLATCGDFIVIADKI